MLCWQADRIGSVAEVTSTPRQAEAPAATPARSRAFDTSGRYPPPRLSRWGIFWRYGLVVLNVALTLLVAVLIPPDPSLPGFMAKPWFWAVDLGLGVAAILLMRWRRRHPLLIVLVVSALSIGSGTAALPLAWAMVSLASRRRWRPIAVAAAAVFASGILSVVLTSGSAVSSWIDVLILTFVMFIATGFSVVLGLFVGARRDLVSEMRQRAEDAEREQELRVLQGQAQERNRIAREMHDVLAHRLSLVSMHAGALAFRDDLSPEETRDIAQTIQQNAHLSLTELRGVLGSLREDTVPTNEIAKPQPQQLDVDDLVAEARAAGTRLDYDNTIEHAELLPTLTARHMYRIIQEALTNARKHAPGCRVWLRLGGAPGEGLFLVAGNKLPTGARAAVPGSRVGLVGVRERVDVTGGRMSVRHDDHEFELEVSLPW